MSIIERIDTWLINKPYQGLVEWSQRKPAWWLDNCGAALAVSTILLYLIRERTGWATPVLVLDLIIAGMFFIWSRSDAMLERARREAVLRQIIMILSLPLIIAICLQMTPIGALQVMKAIAFLSGYYFACCRPPTPREPRRKLVPTV